MISMSQIPSPSENFDNRVKEWRFAYRPFTGLREFWVPRLKQIRGRGWDYRAVGPSGRRAVAGFGGLRLRLPRGLNNLVFATQPLGFSDRTMEAD